MTQDVRTGPPSNTPCLGWDPSRPVDRARDRLAEFCLLLDGSLREQTALRSESYDDETAPAGEDPAQWLKFLSSPKVPAYVFQHARQSEAGTHFPLREILTFDPGARLVHELEIWSRPHPIFRHLLRTVGKGSRGSSSERADFVKPTSQILRDTMHMVSDALAMLQEFAPGFRSDTDTFIEAIAIADGNASFRGASGVAYRGLIFFSPQKAWNDLTWCEELVHETTHNILMVIAASEPLVNGTNAYQETFTGPFRSDLRHPHGNLHALTVIARCVGLFNAFLDKGLNTEYFASRRKDYVDRGLKTLASMEGEVEWSALGRNLLDNTILPALRT